MSTFVVVDRLCKCGHSASDHEAAGDACVYGWDDWTPLSDAERAADPCDCEGFVFDVEIVAPRWDDAVRSVQP